MGAEPSSAVASGSSGAGTEGQKKPRRFGCGTMILAFVGIVVLTMGVLFWLVRSEPAHWQARRAYIESHTQEELLKTAELVEQRLLASLNGASTMEPVSHHSEGGEAGGEDPSDSNGGGDPVPDGAEPAAVDAPDPEPRTVRLSINEVNAWMNQRLQGWMEHQGMELPAGVEEPMLTTDVDRLVLAFRYRKGSVSQVVSLKFTVELSDDAEATVRLDEIQAGKLPLPGGVAKQMGRLGGSAGQAAEDRVKKLAEAFDGMRFDPILDLSDQSVRLVGVTMDEGGIDLEVR